MHFCLCNHQTAPKKQHDTIVSGIVHLYNYVYNDGNDGLNGCKTGWLSEEKFLICNILKVYFHSMTELERKTSSSYTSVMQGTYAGIVSASDQPRLCLKIIYKLVILGGGSLCTLTLRFSNNGFFLSVI